MQRLTRHLNRLMSGFSLIELMIVISIMAVIVGIASASYTTAQKQSRDARRKADLHQIQVAYEQYLTANNTYSASISAVFTSLSLATPTDPKNVTPYLYAISKNNTSYCACATLENAGKGNADGIVGTSSGTFSCDWNSTGDKYCVQNQQ